MKSQMGLWIDHREAIIVTLGDAGEDIQHVTSDVEESVTDADAPHVSQQDRHKKRVNAHLSKFYEKLTLIPQCWLYSDIWSRTSKV